jgi:hypothetical protein
MRRLHVRLVLLAGVASVALAVAGIDRSHAEDAAAPAAPALKGKFVRGLVGAWETEISEGVMGKGKGRSTWRFALGETAAIEDYDMNLTAPDGTTAPMRYHIVVRETGGGSGLEGWMFDESEVAPKHFVGTYSDAGFEATCKTPGGTLRVTCAAEGEARVFHLYMGETLLQQETYRPAAK